MRQLGAPLGLNADGTDERAGVYLTNALTGWEPAKEPKTQIALYPEFEDERDAADHVKQSEKSSSFWATLPMTLLAVWRWVKSRI